MSAATFPFKQNFPGLYSSSGAAPDVDFACSVVETEWAGIFGFWSLLPAALMTAKQQLLEAYLVAWWLADMYPTKVRGIQADGGMPLTGKSIGGVSISRQKIELQPGLEQLGTNAFGVKAAKMILGAPERMLLVQGAMGGPVPVGSWGDLGNLPPGSVGQP
jgi:hypothetical protein